MKNKMSIYTTGSLELRGTADTLFLTASHDAVGPKIGIGMSTVPGVTFAVNDDLGLTDTSTQVRFTVANNDATGDASLNLGNSVSNRSFILWEGGTDRRLRFGTRASGVNYFNTMHMKDGSIGIGGDPELSSPAVDLHVKGTNKAAMIGENATEPAAASIAYFGNSNTLIQRQSGADSAAEFQLQSACATDISVTARSGGNAPGRSMTVSAGQGTGTGDGGDLTLRAAPGGSAGSSVNTYTNTLTISGQEDKATFTGKVLVGGDTAAGDDAAIGYTASEGIIITGQGSSTDFAIKNDADQTLISAGTGTTLVDIPFGRLAVGDDTDGNDRVLNFGHATIKSIVGIDDSQDLFAINTDENFETSNDFAIDSDGNVTIGNGNLIIDGGEIRPTAGTGNLKLYSDGDVTVEIDSDNSGTTSKFVVASNNETPRFEVDESGNVQMDGDLTVDGDDINFSGSGTVFSDGGSLTLKADTNMEFQIDVDNSANNSFTFKNGAGQSILTLTEGATGADFMTLGKTATAFTINGPENSDIKFVTDNDFVITLDSDDDGDGEFLIKDGIGPNTILKLEEDGKLTLGKTGTGTVIAAPAGLALSASGTDTDIAFSVNDGGVDFTALTLDGSIKGNAMFTPKSGGVLNVKDDSDTGFFQIDANGRFNMAEHNSDTANEAPKFTFYRTRNIGSSPTPPAANDYLGSICFAGYDTGFGDSAEIRGVAAAAHGSSGDTTDTPGKLEFYTVPDGSSTLTKALTINSDQTSNFTNTINGTDGSFTGTVTGTTSVIGGAVTGSQGIKAIGTNHREAGLMIYGAANNHAARLDLKFDTEFISNMDENEEIGSINFKAIDDADPVGKRRAQILVKCTEEEPSNGPPVSMTFSTSDTTGTENLITGLKISDPLTSLSTRPKVSVPGGLQVGNAGANSAMVAIGGHNDLSATLVMLDVKGDYASSPADTQKPVAVFTGHAGFTATQGVVEIHSTDTGTQTGDTVLKLRQDDPTSPVGFHFAGYTNNSLIGGYSYSGTLTPFTGRHYTQLDGADSYRLGTIMKSTGELIYEDPGEAVDNAWVKSTGTTTAKDPGVVGVYSGPCPGAGGLDNTHGYNAVGEGKVLVTDEGGNISIGDYVCSSNRSGHGMKQDDDLLHNYTVAKALTSIDWSTVETDPELGFKSALLACTYHCG